MAPAGGNVDVKDVVAFIEAYRANYSNANAPPNAISVQSVVRALCAHYRVMNFEDLMGTTALQLPALRQLNTLNQRLWSFVTCFVQSRRVNTLYECHHAFLQQEGIREFRELRMGNSFVHTEAVQSLYHSPMTMFPVSTRDVLNHLRQFESLLGHDAFRSSSHIDRNEFAQYVAQQYRQPSVEAMGVAIDPSGFGVYIGMLRRIANQELKEMKALEQEFQKGIAEKVFELTKEKFSADNRKQALDELLQRQPSSVVDDDTSDSWVAKKRKRQNANTMSSLSLEMLRRVTDVDVYLDNLLRRKAVANAQDQRKQISSQEIAENDLKIRNQLTRFLMGTQKSKHHSRIKVVTWVLCGIMAKIQALLLHDDKVPDDKDEEEAAGAAKRKKESKESEDDDDECDCCCVGKDTCKCACTCECHANSSDEEEEKEKSKKTVITSKSNSALEAIHKVATVNTVVRIEEIKEIVEEYLTSHEESMSFTTRKDLVQGLRSIEEHVGQVFDSKYQKSAWALDQSLLQVLADLSENADECSKSPWSALIDKSGRYRASSSSISKEELIGFIQQGLAFLSISTSHATNEDKLDYLADRILLEFDCDDVQGLGFGTLNALVKEAQDMMDDGVPSNSIMKYSNVIVGSADEHYIALTVDTESGESAMQVSKTNEALAQLLECPFLVDVAVYMDWQQQYARYCGPLRCFIRTHEMILVDHASALPTAPCTMLFLCCINGSIVRVDDESTPSTLANLLRESDEAQQIDAAQVAIPIVSMLVKHDGQANFPKQLVQVHLRALFDHLSKTSPRDDEIHSEFRTTHRLLLEILLRVPVEFAGFIYSTLREVVASLNSSLLGLEGHTWNSCFNDSERTQLAAVGKHNAIVAWADRMPKIGRRNIVVSSVQNRTPAHERSTSLQDQKSMLQTTAGSQLAAIDARFDDVSKTTDDLIGTSQDTLKVASSDGSALTCQSFIKSLRKKQFGVGLEILDSAASAVLQIQQQRLERALKRLSDELYSENTHFVLELLQNADDNAYASGIIPKGEFTLTDRHEIVFFNNENGFSEANIQAICDVGASTKALQASGTSIGKKGIGFKSVFKVSDVPQVHSNGFHIRFYAKNDSHGSGLGYILPYWIEDETEWKNETGTTFVLPLNELSRQQTNDISQSMMALEPAILLFLRRIQELRLHDAIHNQRMHFIRQDSIVNSHQLVSLHSQILHHTQVVRSEQKWLLVKESLRVPAGLSQGHQQETDIALALPLDKHVSDNVDDRPPLQQVFAYLPLRSYGFRFILQGDFEVPSSREAITNGSDWNQWLISQFPLLLRKIVASFTELYETSEMSTHLARLMAVLPFESEIQAPFRSLVSEMMREIRQLSCLPHAFIQGNIRILMKPTELLDASELAREGHDLTVLLDDDDVIFSTFNKRLLELDLSNQIHPVLKSQLRIEKLKASHFLQLLTLSSKKNNLLWTVNVLNLLSKLWKRDRHASLLLQELRLIKCFPMQVNGQIVWKSLAESRHGLFIADSQSLKRKHSYSFYGQLNVVHQDFVARIDEFPEARVFLVQHVGVKTLEDHHLISHHILPQMLTLGEGKILSETDTSEPTRLMIDYATFIAFHLSKCKTCTLDGEIQTKFRVLTARNRIVNASDTQVFVVLPSILKHLPKLLKWMTGKLLNDPTQDWDVIAFINYFKHLDGDDEKHEKDERNWKKLLSQICGMPAFLEMCDARSLVPMRQLLVWIEAELDVDTKTIVSTELAKFVDTFWPSNSDDIPFEVIDLLQEHNWLSGLDGNFHPPRCLWAKNGPNEVVFTNAMVSFGAYVWTNTRAMEGLSMKQSPCVSDVLNVVNRLAREKPDLTIEDMTRLYSFLSDQSVATPSCRKQIAQAFQDGALVFIPAIENGVKQSFAAVKSLVWSSSVPIVGMAASLDTFYASLLQAFFTEVCGVAHKPLVGMLCEQLIHTDASSTRKQWKKNVLPILRTLSKHIKKAAMSKDEFKATRKVLKRVAWLPVASSNNGSRLSSLQDHPALAKDEDEQEFVRDLVKLWKKSNINEAAEVNASEILIAQLDNDIRGELDALLEFAKISSARSHVVEYATEWCGMLVKLTDRVQISDTKLNKKFQSIAKRLVIMWATAYASNGNAWTSKKSNSFQWTLQQAAIFTCIGASKPSTSPNMYLNDQGELSKDEIESAAAQNPLVVLALFPWSYFEDWQQDDSKASVYRFLCDFCSMKSLKQQLRYEIVVLGEQNAVSSAFRSRVLQGLSIVQRYLRHHHPTLYKQLSKETMVNLARSLRCLVVDGSEGVHVVYRVGSSFSLRRRAWSSSDLSACFLDLSTCTLYVKEQAHTIGYYEVMMEICRKCFNSHVAPSAANVMYLASLQDSEAQRERWLQETQQLPSWSSLADENDLWVDAVYSANADEAQVTGKAKRSHSERFMEDGEVEEDENDLLRVLREKRARVSVQSPAWESNLSYAQNTVTDPSYSQPLYQSYAVASQSSHLPPLPSSTSGTPRDDLLPSTVGGNNMTKEEREAIGRWGEQYVYDQLRQSYEQSNPSLVVTWVNEHEESGHPYDLTISQDDKIVEYVEVKATRTMEKGVFEISMNELDQAAIHGSSYSIYRVFNAGNASLCRVIRMKNPIALVRQKKMQLALVMQ